MVCIEVGGAENVPGIPGAYATRNFAYLARGPFNNRFDFGTYKHPNIIYLSNHPFTKLTTCDAVFGSQNSRSYRRHLESESGMAI